MEVTASPMLAEKPLDLPYRPCVGIMLINRARSRVGRAAAAEVGGIWIGSHLADAPGRHHARRG